MQKSLDFEKKTSQNEELLHHIYIEDARLIYVKYNKS